MHSTPVEIRAGLNGMWDTRCTECNVPTCTNLEGIRTFEDAEERRKQLNEDLRSSCPNHKSKWFLTMEDVERQRLERRSQYTII